MNKDWMDAVREQCLSEETPLSPDGWYQISHKMRRATARRRGAIAVIVLVPVVVTLLWSPWRQPSFPEVTESTPIAVNETPYNFIVPAVVPEETPFIQRSIPATRSKLASVASMEEVAPPVPLETPPVLSDTSSVNMSSPSDIQGDAKEPSVGLFELISAPNPRPRPLLSFGMRAGTGMTRRHSSVELQSAPYMAGLAYLNVLDPKEVIKVKANSGNMTGIGLEANQFFPEYSTDQYRHDLPVSLGITVRMDLNSWAGVESGIEYTYLHSAVESVAGPLEQRLHFIGIPLRLDARLLSRGRFDLYAGVGAKMEKCVSASFGMVRCEERRLQWSAEAFAGVQYGLWNRTHLFFQPEVSYYFTGTDLLTYRTEHPFTITLQAGLRFDL